MANFDRRHRLEEARKQIDAGSIKKAYGLLESLISEGDPEALFLYSTFSMSGTETESEFEIRSFKLLQQAAQKNYGPALYALGNCYESGDLIQMNKVEAAKLFEKAVAMGFLKANIPHGLNLFYGSNGVSKNEQEGLALIERAARAEVEGASDVLLRLKAR